MSTAERIARLQTLLNRVLDRKDAPRTSSASLVTAVTPAAPVAAVPPPSAAAPVEDPPWLAPVPARPATLPPPSRPSSHGEDLPDLEFVETMEGGERRPSLVPSVRPPATAAEQDEFEIPAYAPPPSIVPPADAAAIELEPEPLEASLEIDRAPLASAIPPRLEPEPPLPPGLAWSAEPASIEAVESLAPASLSSDEAMEIEPVASMPPPREPSTRPAAPVWEAAAAPQHFEGRALPDEPVLEVLPLTAAPRPASFRALLERALALRVR